MKKHIISLCALLALCIMIVSCNKESGGGSLSGTTWMVTDYELLRDGSTFPKSEDSDHGFSVYEGLMLRFDNNGKTGSFGIDDFTYTNNGNTITMSSGSYEGLTMTVEGKRLKTHGWVSIPRYPGAMAEDRVEMVLIMEKQ